MRISHLCCLQSINFLGSVNSLSCLSPTITKATSTLFFFTLLLFFLLLTLAFSFSHLAPVSNFLMVFSTPLIHPLLILAYTNIN